MQNINQQIRKDGGRRNFLKQAGLGLTGSLLAAGNLPVWAQQKADDSLKITKVEPVLLTGLRASAPWVFVRVETADGFVGWGEGTNYPGVRPIATAVTTLSSVIIGQSAWNIEALWQRMYRFMYYNGMGGIVLTNQAAGTQRQRRPRPPHARHRAIRAEYSPAARRR